MVFLSERKKNPKTYISEKKWFTHLGHSHSLSPPWEDTHTHLGHSHSHSLSPPCPASGTVFPLSPGPALFPGAISWAHSDSRHFPGMQERGSETPSGWEGKWVQIHSLSIISSPRNHWEQVLCPRCALVLWIMILQQLTHFKRIKLLQRFFIFIFGLS